MPEQIKEIQALEWGDAVNEDHTYTHCLLVDFLSQDDLEAYAKHPAHAAVPANYGDMFAGATVVDYWI